jgi:hypothetical protein
MFGRARQRIRASSPGALFHFPSDHVRGFGGTLLPALLFHRIGTSMFFRFLDPSKSCGRYGRNVNVSANASAQLWINFLHFIAVTGANIA